MISFLNTEWKVTTITQDFELVKNTKGTLRMV